MTEQTWVPKGVNTEGSPAACTSERLLAGAGHE